MEHQINKLSELLWDCEGIDGNEDETQLIRNLRGHWEHADLSFHSAYYQMRANGPDIMRMYPAIDEMQEAFGKLEKCCNEWRKYMRTLLPPGSDSLKEEI